MAAMSDYLENKLIDHCFRGVSFTAPAALHVELYTAAPSDSGGGTAVSGGSYARAALAPSTTNWASTGGATTTTNPSAGTGGATSNNVAITFPAPTANWGVVTHFGIFDASSGGNLLFHGALTASKTVNNGDAVPTFPISSLVITLA
jgi:hypothetical protein